MASTNQYPKFGQGLTVIPAADLISLTSPANARSAARLGDQGFGKRKGMLAVRDSGTGDRYSLVFATGSAPADVWLAADGATKYTPV